MLPHIDGTTEKDHGRILKPILDVATKWNSTFDMLVTALKMREPLVQILDQLYMEKKIPDVPSAGDWDNLTELVHFFQPFKQSTMECNINKHQTLSYVIPWYNVLLDHCENAVSDYGQRLDASISGTPASYRRIANESLAIDTLEI
ncbi:hypothetical protein QVD99_007470 [Batrachochytrium dendrobatidis]|nr:hypothetical protein QVD99_007470 [Batrachochytrium dendrobatidis]